MSNIKIYNIIYISFVSRSHIGVIKKNNMQIREWERAGASVKAVFDFDKFGALFKYMYRYLILFKYFVFSSHKDKIYLRQTVCLPLMVWIVKFKSFSYEVNADIDQERKALSLFKRLIFLFLPDKFVNEAEKIFFVSKEISERYSFSGQKYIYPNSMPPPIKKLVFPRGNKILFVGNSKQKWQGFDLLCDFFDSLPDYEFHLVGDLEYIDKENVVNHGILTGESYINIISNSDYAIGTLAFFRSGLKEGSPLKVRDYLSFDLPVIVGYEDSDFNASRFIKVVDTKRSHVNFTELRLFLDYWRFKTISTYIDESVICTNREASRLVEIFK